MWAGASSAHSSAEGEFNQENGGWRLISLSLSLPLRFLFFLKRKKNQTTLFVSHSWPREEGCALCIRLAHPTSHGRCCREAPPAALTQPTLGTAPFPHCPPRCRCLCPAGSAGSPGTSEAQRGRKHCCSEVASAGHRGPRCSLGTYPACHSRQSRFLGQGVVPAPACPGYR